MPTNIDYFKDIVHAADSKGVLCNATLGKMGRSRPVTGVGEDITCRKCLKFIEHPDALTVARKHRESEEYKAAQERAKELRDKKKERKKDRDISTV